MIFVSIVKGVKKVVNNYFVGTKKEQEFNDFYSFFFCIEQKVRPHVHNPNKTLDEQNVSKTAKAIIAILFRDYWATEIQKEKIISKQNYDRTKFEEEMKARYN